MSRHPYFLYRSDAATSIIYTVPCSPGFSLSHSASMAHPYHYDTYREELLKAYPGFGHALWEPDPGEQNTSFGVGDVGFIREGRFHHLFNALLPAESG